MYYHVLIERYKTGRVDAAIISNKLADERPADFYRRGPGHNITIGRWFESATDAQAVISYELNSAKIAA